MKICIAHFRVGLTDGVSLQIDERARILEQFGHKIDYIADLNSPIADLRIPYFTYKDNLKIVEIQNAAFGGKMTPKLVEEIEEIAAEIEVKLTNFWREKRFSLIFIHNIFSLPVCLPATIAFYNFLKKNPSVRGVTVHHDFWWDPPRRDKFMSKSPYIRKIRRKYFPPKLPNLSHTVISVWEKRVLYKKRKINAEVITDTFDFDQGPWKKDESNKDYLKDAGLTGNELKILLASRIRTRKGIELGVDFIAHLQKRIGDREVVLILPNDYTAKEKEYIRLLKEKASRLNVRVLWLQDLVGSEEEKAAGIKKYSLWDTYIYSDAIVYPSLWEGFGNQFLEAVFAKKPIVVFEYPVFSTDIKPAGFDVINMGKVVSHDKFGLAQIPQSGGQNAAYKLAKLLKDEKGLKKMTNMNFEIGRRFFNTKRQLKDYLSENSFRYINSNGIKIVISPLLLSGKLVASGMRPGEAYDIAESIISEVPESGYSDDEFFAHVVTRLNGNVKPRYVTLELVKEFLTSKKAKSPLFIFLGGVAGKTTLTNLVVNHLGISQSVAFDNEKKYHIAKPEGKSYLWKATYESAEAYIKTIKDMYPHLLKMIERDLFDYKRYRKWCYFWEGIYLSSEIVKDLHDKNEDIYFLSVFLLPQFKDVKKMYILRWQKEMGIEKLKVKKNVIDKYLNNVKAIRSHIEENLDPIASFVIESPLLEERLSAFYAVLHAKLIMIANREIPGWIEKVAKNPNLIVDYKKFLQV